MGLFWQSRKPGITDRELSGKRFGQTNLRNRFSTILGANKLFGGEVGRRKVAALTAALGVGLDADRDTPRDQHVIQRDEFDAAVRGLVDEKVLTSHEAEKLTKAAEHDLNNY